jgi:drug/metabolite transporter (DMT)-like permease
VPLDALGLALGAAALHAFWNLLLARERDTEAATAVAVLSLVVILALPAALTWRVERAAVPYLAASAALELAYVALLAAAYRRFELSVVYPVARGMAPVLALVITVLVTLAWPSVGEIAGILAVAAGVLLVRGRAPGSTAALAAGLVVASMIAGYTVVDRYGIQHANVAPYLGARRVARAVSPMTVVIGAASAGAYLLVLLALRLASAPAVAAVRETSVVIATALAAVVLRERVSAVRIAGAVLVAAGVAVLALA